jgi:hypothetical protein
MRLTVATKALTTTSCSYSWQFDYVRVPLCFTKLSQFRSHRRLLYHQPVRGRTIGGEPGVRGRRTTSIARATGEGRSLRQRNAHRNFDVRLLRALAEIMVVDAQCPLLLVSAVRS